MWIQSQNKKETEMYIRMYPVVYHKFAQNFQLKMCNNLSDMIAKRVIICYMEGCSKRK